MRHPTIRLAIVGFVGLAVALLLAACAGDAGPAGPAGAQGPAGETGPQGAAYVPPGPGLMVEITGAEFPAEGNPVVTVNITDPDGIALTAEGLEGFGFTVAQIVVDSETGLSKYQSLLLREVEGKPYTMGGESKQPALAKASQPFADNGGTWVPEGDGKYSYTFANPLSLPVDTSLTTVIGMSAYKDGRTVVANDVYTFVPAGGEPQVTREVVVTETCNSCHKELAFHGGTRRDTALCVTCHTDQLVDPESSNNLEFKVLIHRLHSGKALPSVAAGTPYFIVGYRQSLFDFSYGLWPQDTRNCTTCHTGGAQADNFKTAPNTAACTACHDDVNLATGDNHEGGRKDDTKCAGCHEPDGEAGDSSITGAHVIPPVAFKQTIELTITPPANGEFYVAGETPALTIVIKDAATGAVIDPNTLLEPADPQSVQEGEWRRVNLYVSGPRNGTVPVLTTAALEADPTHTYANNDLRILKDADKADPNLTRTETAMTYQLGDVAGLKRGTYTAFIEIMPNAPLGAWAQLNFQVGTATEEPKPATNCTQCHSDNRMHAGYFAVQFNPDTCKSCHDYLNQGEGKTGWSDSNWGYGAGPLARRVHGVHFGEGLDKPQEVHTRVDYSHVVFPQDVRNCTTCHSETDAWTQNPSRLACLACHDTDEVITHAALMTVDPTPADPWSGDEQETCAVCHSGNSEFAPAKVHALP